MALMALHKIKKTPNISRACIIVQFINNVEANACFYDAVTGLHGLCLYMKVS